MALRAFYYNPALGGFGDETETSATTTSAAAGGRARLLISSSCSSYSSTKKNISSSDENTTSCEARSVINSFPDSHHTASCGGGDAFAQIIKELVDNAVDACNLSSSTQNFHHRDDENSGSVAPKKVTVVIDKVEEDDEFVKAEFAKDHGGSDPDNYYVADAFLEKRELLRVVVSDNGCGMEDVEKCVSVFSSNKNQDDFTNYNGCAAAINDNSQRPVLGTAGRYGLGLTLCILHAQRLVPNSCVIIQSTVQNSALLTKFKFVVDTERDSVVCVHRENFVKKEKSDSGTSVFLLLPGGLAALKAWPRLAEYFARYQLSLGLKCSLEVLAPSLSRVPLLIRPTSLFETGDLYLQQVVMKKEVGEISKHDNYHVVNTFPNYVENSTNAMLLTEDRKATGEDNSSYTDDVFELSECQVAGSFPSRVSLDNSSVCDQKTNISKQTHNIDCTLDLEDIFMSTESHLYPPNKGFAAENTRQKDAAEEKETNMQKRREMMQKAVGMYLKKSIDVMNVAHSKQIIRRNMINGTVSLKNYPNVEVDVIVSGIDNLINEDKLACSSVGYAFSGNDADYSKARIMLIRMVNGIPLLDGADASACGVVRCLQHKNLWNSFGLEISPLTTQSLPGVIEKTCRSIPDTLNVPTFLLSDSVHVAPFFTKNNAHCLYNDEDENSCSSDSEYNTSSFDGRAVRHKAKKRRRSLSLETTLKPAGLRLGTILIVVHLNANSYQLPLPTLSKGRLPMNDKAINIALHTGLTDCLRSLQRTNPKLFLAPSQLKKTEREVIFVPSFASALSSLILNSNSIRTKRKCLSTLGIKTFDSVHAERRNTTETQIELTSLIENFVRRTLKLYDDNRKKDAIEKRVVSYAKKASTKNQETMKVFHNDDGESSSISTVDCNFDEFLGEIESSVMQYENLDFGRDYVLSTVTTNDEEEEMKSTFSSESFNPKAASQEIETASSSSSSSELLEYDHW